MATRWTVSSGVALFGKPAVIAPILLQSSLALAGSIAWNVNTNGLWTTAADWAPVRIPTSSDDVVIDRPAGLYNVTISSGTQSINSLLSNENLTVSGGVLAVATTAQIGGTVTLSGGSLRSGTWTGGAMTATGSASIIDGIEIGNDLALANGATLGVANSLVLSGSTVSFGSTGSYTTLSLGGVQAISGSGALVFGGTGSLNRITSGTLTLGAGIAVRTGAQGGQVSLGSGGTNNGIISAETAGTAMTVSGSQWVNNGVLNAAAGTLTLSGSWSNLGTLRLSGGTLDLSGSFSQVGQLSRTGTANVVSLSGTLDRGGDVLQLDHTTGSWNLVGGTIRNTKIVFAEQASLAPSPFSVSTTSRLDHTSLSGDWAFPANGFVGVQNGMSLENARVLLGSGAQITFFHYDASQALDGTGEVLLPSTGQRAILLVSNYATRSLTIKHDVRIHGGNGLLSISMGYSTPGLINQGTIEADVAGTTVEIDGTTFRNEGVLLASAGTIKANSPFASAGTIAIAGTGAVSVGTLYVEANGRVGADLDSLDPLNSTGRITAGLFSLSSSGETYLDLQGGMPGKTYTLISASQGVSGRFTQVASGYQVVYGLKTVQVTVIPEPASIGLACFGSLLLIRRRCR